MGTSPVAAAGRVAHMGLTVFSEFSRLALQHGAVNLGQGFPDFDGPQEIMERAIQAMRDGKNQYAFTRGVPELRRAIAEHAYRFYGQRVNPDTEVVVTSGATEAIFDTVMAFCDPGDEVILFQPAYDSYAASVQMAGGAVRSVMLRAPNEAHATWWFDAAELEATFSSRTKLVMLNTPHNPTGKVFTAEELQMIGMLARKHHALVVSDEVYEHLVFAPAKHVRMATLFPDETLTLSSGGKSFSFTGWKVGWVIGRPDHVTAIANAHQWVSFATGTPFQHAIAAALALPDTYFAGYIAAYTQKRDRLKRGLEAAGLQVLPCEGAYFLLADISRLGHSTDVTACRWLTEHARVAAIPPSVFYAPEVGPQHLARFAFCKQDELLDEAARRLLTALP